MQDGGGGDSVGVQHATGDGVRPMCAMYECAPRTGRAPSLLPLQPCGLQLVVPARPHQPAQCFRDHAVLDAWLLWPHAGAHAFETAF